MLARITLETVIPYIVGDQVLVLQGDQTLPGRIKDFLPQPAQQRFHQPENVYWIKVDQIQYSVQLDTGVVMEVFYSPDTGIYRKAGYDKSHLELRHN